MTSAARFDPLRAQPEPAFFRDASECKLHKWRLDDAPQVFTARLRPSIVSRGVMRFDEASFGDTVESAGTDRFSPVVPGTMLCFNTLEEFKTCDKSAIITNAGAKVLSSILSGAATRDPGLLCQTLALVHLGIKSHRYVIWPAFPALAPPSEHPILAMSTAEHPVEHVQRVWAAAAPHTASAASIATDEGPAATLMRDAISSLINRSPHSVLPAAFGIVVGRTAATPAATAALALTPPTGEVAPSVSAVSLAELEILASRDHPLFIAEVAAGRVMLAVADPGASPDHAGWTARNAFVWAALRLRLRGAALCVLCLRPGPDGGVDSPPASAASAPRRDLQSILLRYQCAALSSDGLAASAIDLPSMAAWCSVGAGQALLKAAGMTVTGWELQPVKGKAGLVPRPRVFSLASLMDKRALVETAARLNLSLMKWRVMPSLKQTELEELSCLLLGAGTLGCHVARCLMGWGVRHITFVDNGRVSYSNPVRQPLFEFDDVAGAAGPKFKAEAAAAAMRRIFPASRAEGKVLTIPMPGHAEVRLRCTRLRLLLAV